VSNSEKSGLLQIPGRTARTQVYPQAEGDTRHLFRPSY